MRRCTACGTIKISRFHTISRQMVRKGIFFLVVVVIAAFLRLWHLNAVPAGMHQDEAWFAYNAMLLSRYGETISGERWTLTVDMWGDHVSSFHSYMIAPFITLFGTSTFIFRLPFVLVSLLTLVLSSWLLYLWTKRASIVAVFAVLFAVSPWNIVMTRASSSVIIDSLVTIILLCILTGGIHFFASQERKKSKTFHLVVWWALLYGTMVFNYFTYFTSRLTLPLLVAATVLILWKRYPLSKTLLGVIFSSLVAYTLFPFLTLLQTPFAMGRYAETTIINSELVKGRLFENIARSGQAGFPIWFTRALFNQVTENARAIIEQYLVLFSPKTMLFELKNPIRYFVPNTGPVSVVEYVGFLLAGFGAVFWRRTKNTSNYQWTALVLVGMTVIALVPTALTIDDFPNFQRGVFATPYWQMAAAVGLYLLYQAWMPELKKVRLFAKLNLRLVLSTIGASAIVASSLSFGVYYYFHGPYTKTLYRSVAGERLGRWINENVSNDVIVFDHDEANFLYSYLYTESNIRELGVTSSDPYLLKAKEFQIGNRYYLNRLCEKADLLLFLQELQPEYIIIKLYPPQERCLLPKAYQLVESIPYDDQVVGYEIYKNTKLTTPNEK